MLHAAFRILRMFAAGGEYTRSNHGSGYFSYKTLPIEDKTVLNDMSVFNKNKELSYIVNIYPNTVISAQLETIAIRYVRPIEIKLQTEVHFHYFARESDSKEMRDLRIKQASNVFGPEGIITLEDASALESVQKSIETDGDTIILKPTKEMENLLFMQKLEFVIFGENGGSLWKSNISIAKVPIAIYL